ncbi:hypothetical protein B4U79_04137, partial [Dinothrombium tinctorium]
TRKVGEQVILSAGLSWINYDLDTFKQHLPSLIEHFTYVSLKETLIGIEDEYPLLKTDTTSNRWIPFPSMEARRSTLGVCVVNNKIYAVGGYDGSTALQSAEYSIKSLANGVSLIQSLQRE